MSVRWGDLPNDLILRIIREADGGRNTHKKKFLRALMTMNWGRPLANTVPFTFAVSLMSDGTSPCLLKESETGDELRRWKYPKTRPWRDPFIKTGVHRIPLVCFPQYGEPGWEKVGGLPWRCGWFDPEDWVY